MSPEAYAVAPVSGWLVAGTHKLIINCVRKQDLAFREIGYGGSPSTHTTVVPNTLGAVLV